MTDNQNRAGVRLEIRRILAAHYACDERDFVGDEVTIVEARAMPGRMPFPLPAKPLMIATMGTGVVVSAHAERLSGLREMIGQMQRDDIFSIRMTSSLLHAIEDDAQDIVGPHLKYTCAREDLRPAAVPPGVGIELFQRDRIADCFNNLAATSSLTYQGRGPQPDAMATVATRAGEAIGVAGASADTDDLWQIAVEVRPHARGSGVGRALVGQLTAGILAAGKIPYYTTVMSHIVSRALAIGLGYWPVWTEMFARDRPARR